MPGDFLLTNRRHRQVFNNLHSAHCRAWLAQLWALPRDWAGLGQSYKHCITLCIRCLPVGAAGVFVHRDDSSRACVLHPRLR